MQFINILKKKKIIVNYKIVETIYNQHKDFILNFVSL